MLFFTQFGSTSHSFEWEVDRAAALRIGRALAQHGRQTGQSWLVKVYNGSDVIFRESNTTINQVYLRPSDFAWSAATATTNFTMPITYNLTYTVA